MCRTHEGETQTPMAPMAPDEEKMLGSATRAMQEVKALTKNLDEACRRHSEKRKVCEAAERDEEEAQAAVTEASHNVKVAMKRLYETAAAYFLTFPPHSISIRASGQ